MSKYQQDKQFSEFNHRLAGFFVLLAGAVILAQGPLSRCWPQSRYAWPVFLFLPGLYLFFWSNPESWPLGPETLVYMLAVDGEVLQHKVFSVILLSLGAVEFERLRGRLAGRWSALVFPVLALVGSVLLLLHPHNPGLHGLGQSAALERIQSQHRAFSAVGACIAASKALWEVGRARHRFFAHAWPLLMMVLGVLLLRYTE